MNTMYFFSQSFRRAAKVAAGLLLGISAVIPSHAATRHIRHTYLHKTLTHRHRTATALIAGTQPTPPDSYLKYKVYSVSDIVKQLSDNPRLIHYYAKTWNKSDSYVLHYISNYVQESYIPETRYYTVYCVRPNGLVYPTKQKMAKGTKVFALKNGEPIMKWLCGNPLGKYLQVVYPAPPQVTKVKDVVQLLPAETEQEVVPSETPVIAPATPVHILPTAATRLITSGGSHAISPAYLGLAAVPFLHTHHPGGSSPTMPLSPTPPGSPTSPGFPISPTQPGSPSAPGFPGTPVQPGSPAAVPELGSGSALALGFVPLALLAWYASARKNARNV